MNGKFHTPATFLPGKNFLYPLNRRLGGFLSHSGNLGGGGILNPGLYSRLRRPDSY